MNREEAHEKINKIIAEIDAKWKEATQIADEAGVSFQYYTPDENSSGAYYPKRPDDWVVCDEDECTYDENPNKDHPEYEDYHPWNDPMGYCYDWNRGHWVSSSERC